MHTRKILLIFIIFLSRNVCGQINFETEGIDLLIPYHEVKSADIDNNGTDDLVLGTITYNIGGIFPKSTENNIEIYFKDGIGNFVLHQIFQYSADSIYESIETIDINDMNNDGLKDLIIGYGNKIAVYYQDINHIFSQHFVYNSKSGIEWVSCGDLNGDSFQDIVLSGIIYHEISILYQNDNQLFDTVVLKPNCGAVINEPELADINNDKLLDIIFIGNAWWEAPIYALLNDSVKGLTGVATPLLQEYAEIRFNSIELGYINNDSLIDIVFTSGGNNDGKVYISYEENSNDMKFRTDTISTYDMPTAIKIIDLNNDSINDIVINHDNWEIISIYEQIAPETFGPLIKFGTFHGNMNDDGWAFGNFNDDNLIDIFIPAAGGINIMWNTSDIIDNTSNIKMYDVESLNVYPNPAKEVLNISIKEQNSNFEHVFDVEIFNMLGIKVKRIEKLNKKAAINITDIEQGLYLYQIKNNGKLIKSGKFVKY